MSKQPHKRLQGDEDLTERDVEEFERYLRDLGDMELEERGAEPKVTEEEMEKFLEDEETEKRDIDGDEDEDVARNLKKRWFRNLFRNIASKVATGLRLVNGFVQRDLPSGGEDVKPTKKLLSWLANKLDKYGKSRRNVQ